MSGGELFRLTTVRQPLGDIAVGVGHPLVHPNLHPVNRAAVLEPDPVAFEHDAPLAQLRAGGQHGHVDGCATTQAGELHSIGVSRQPEGRPQRRRQERNGRAALGNAREVGDRARVGPCVSEREQTATPAWAARFGA